jgi:hypothetical protein
MLGSSLRKRLPTLGTGDGRVLPAWERATRSMLDGMQSVSARCCPRRRFATNPAWTRAGADPKMRAGRQEGAHGRAELSVGPRTQTDQHQQARAPAARERLVRAANRRWILIAIAPSRGCGWLRP